MGRVRDTGPAPSAVRVRMLRHLRARFPPRVHKLWTAAVHSRAALGTPVPGGPVEGVDRVTAECPQAVPSGRTRAAHPSGPIVEVHLVLDTEEAP